MPSRCNGEARDRTWIGGNVSMISVAPIDSPAAAPANPGMVRLPSIEMRRARYYMTPINIGGSSSG